MFCNIVHWGVEKMVRRSRGLNRKNEFDHIFYSNKARMRLVEDGAMTYEEEGFMKGYDEAFTDEGL
mgnify:CR=1|jgi:hypothetical protein